MRTDYTVAFHSYSSTLQILYSLGSKSGFWVPFWGPFLGTKFGDFIIIFFLFCRTLPKITYGYAIALRNCLSTRDPSPFIVWAQNRLFRFFVSQILRFQNKNFSYLVGQGRKPPWVNAYRLYRCFPLVFFDTSNIL